jgi:hypothetical protein
MGVVAQLRLFRQRTRVSQERRAPTGFARITQVKRSCLVPARHCYTPPLGREFTASNILIGVVLSDAPEAWPAPQPVAILGDRAEGKRENEDGGSGNSGRKNNQRTSQSRLIQKTDLPN